MSTIAKDKKLTPFYHIEELCFIHIRPRKIEERTPDF